MKAERLPLKLILLLFISVLTFNCSKNDDSETQEPITLNNEVNDFIWKGLNNLYLWQENIANLADNKFTNQDDYYTFLNSYSTPEALFDGLLYEIDVVDKFSFLVDDYTELENYLQGNSNSNGLDFSLVRLSGSDDVFGYIRYVANNSDASNKNIKRGEFFLTVDGEQLTISNYSNLLFGTNNTYTLGMANITDSTITLNGKTVELTKTDFTENPILINKVIESNGTRIGYLMYNQFVTNFESDLNSAFAQLKTQGITELVLDLRYNPGGTGSTAVALASMITGQFNGELFYKEEWNSKYQAYFEANTPEVLVNPFVNTLSNGSAISSLNLNRIYILTTDGTASSSELIINGLKPYIDVVQIGSTTYGKYVGSVTLYDSPDFSKDQANANHKYAMQPIAIKATNANGVSDYYNGISPNYTITYQSSTGVEYEGENLLNLGVLGNEGEPFLAKAISLITGTTTKTTASKANKVVGIAFENVSDTKDFTPLGKNMIMEMKPIK
ncbi:C-terminal processing protease CtpA/Prc [Mariniflexile fucanivorans]|uniref:C-terminal processing protease CtpA/Prc n=1 Tax=Mariniflexile fucanivorans TaxID=264023 RepID=A0A4V2QDN0_9FLAO|nr:S41 family peptidase [Mariniflexile fucanivorans]TCL64477.1 C-terminal processing protease CtpA/Prc [Mariniflexile fucanivorans]